MPTNSSEPVLTGPLSEDKVKGLLAALNSLSKVGIEKIVLEFSSPPEKTFIVNAVNNVNTVYACLKFDSFFCVPLYIKKDFEYGIYNLSDFIGLLELFKSGFDIKMASELASISSNENYLDYYGADTHRIKRKPEGEFESTLLAKIKCDDSFKSFMDSMGRLPHEDVIFKGIPLENIITMSVADKNIRGNNFTKKINVPDIKTDFKVIVKKEYFKNVISTECELNVYKEAIVVKRKEELFEIEYFVQTII